MIFMRRLLLLTVSVLLSLSMLAGPVTREQAKEIASQYFANKSGSHRAAATLQVQEQAVLGQLSSKGNPLMYAVSLGNNQGFVIVSGDDRMRPVLAYSDKDDFNEATMPDNMRAWLEGYAQEMRWLDEHNYQPQQTTNRAIAVKQRIEPLMVTTWDQGDPYNLLCPMDGSNRSVTGCVATAMAQVVYYNAIKSGMPKSLICDIPAYTTDTKKLNVPAVTIADYPMDWDLMLPSYTNSATNEQKTAVAQLMRACGQSVKMNYTSGSSGAVTAYVADAMKTYFGFDTTTRFVYRSGYSLNEWVELIYNEVKSGRAVCYNGQSSGGGHAFVIDGYDGDELFHVNWGWGGSSDGFFALSVLNPGDNSGIGASTTNDGYSFNQGAVIEAQYGTGETYEVPISMTTISLYLEGNTIYYRMYNNTGSTYSFDCGLGYIEDSTIKPYDYTPFNDVPQGYGPGTRSLEFTTDLANANQHIKLFPISKLTTVDTWTAGVNPEIAYVDVVWDEQGVPTLTFHPIEDLEATNIAFTGNKFVNNNQPVEFTIKNNGDEYYGSVFFFTSTDENNKGQYNSYGGITILKNATTTMDFSFTPTTVGTHHVWLTLDEEGNNVIGHATVDITLNTSGLPSATGPLEFSTVVVDNATPWTIENDKICAEVLSNQLTIKFSVTNTSSTETIGGTIWLNLLKYNESKDQWDEKYYFGYNVTMSPNKTIDISPLDYGTWDEGLYKITLTYQSSGNPSEILHDDRYRLTIVKTCAITDESGNTIRTKIEGNSLAVTDATAAIDLSTVDLTTTTVTPNSNPNTLYILSDSQTAPATLNGKNIVKDGVAEQITLTDGQPFYSPIDFTANEITYTREFNKFYSGGKNWSTVVLPFAADEVSNDQKVLPWSATDREFWIMEFVGEDGNSVTFNTPASLQANKPYIIALPGADYGAYSLVGHSTLTFKATNAQITGKTKAVTTGSQYKFVGITTNPGAQSNIYALNEDGDGNKFVKGTATIQPFRAYFTPTSTAPATQSLNIHIGDEMTAIDHSTFNVQRSTFNVYDLQGRKVTNGQWSSQRHTLKERMVNGQLKKGLYIANGRKVVIK